MPDLTLEMMLEAIAGIRRKGGLPRTEWHHPECPKIASGARRACRCGAAPLEAVFEDEDSSSGGADEM